MDDFRASYRWPPVAFLAAFCFASLTSGSVLSERLAHGSASLTVPWSLALMGGALLLWASAARAANQAPLLLAHAAGALAAMLAMHAWLSYSGADARLVEAPRQWVNDGVFFAVVLLMVWSFHSQRAGFRAAAPILLALLLGGYRATAAQWHLDHFPGLPVQQYVVTQSLVIGAGLLLFDLIWSLRSSAEPW